MVIPYSCWRGFTSGAIFVHHNVGRKLCSTEPRALATLLPIYAISPKSTMTYYLTELRPAVLAGILAWRFGAVFRHAASIALASTSFVAALR